MDEFEEIARSRIGTMLRDRYRIEALLGIGGMAAVYRGVHRNGNPVAIKILHPDLSKSKEVRERFLTEGKRANRVAHEGAVRVLDDDLSAEGAPFLVMDLLDGQTVDARLHAAGGKLPLAEVAKIAHDLLDVLIAAHAKDVIHRDLKPENLFLTTSGVLKVLDFGIARMRDGVGTSWTRTGQAMGTPAFMPPEQAMGRTREIDARTDLWAVAATMFTLLSGAYVHVAETVQELLIYAATQPARSIKTVLPDLAPSWVTLIDRALSFKKEARFASAAEMRTAIGEAYRVTFGTSLAGAPTQLEGNVKAASQPPSTKVEAARPLAMPTIHVDSAPAPLRGLALADTVDSVRPAGVARTVDDTLPPRTENAGPLRPFAHGLTEPAAPPDATPSRGAASTTAGLSAARIVTGAHPPVVERSRLPMLAAISAAMLLVGAALAGGALRVFGGGDPAPAAQPAPVVPPNPAPSTVLVPMPPASSARPAPPPPPPPPSPLPAPKPAAPVPPPVKACVGKDRFYCPNPADPTYCLTRPECRGQ